MNLGRLQMRFNAAVKFELSHFSFLLPGITLRFTLIQGAQSLQQSLCQTCLAATAAPPR